MVPMRSACSSSRGSCRGFGSEPKHPPQNASHSGGPPEPPATLRVATRLNSDFGDAPKNALRVATRLKILACCFALLLGCAHGSGREPAASMLEIATSSADADVWVDGEYVGQVAAVSGKLRLAPGVHRVEIRKPGHFPVQRTVRVEKQSGGAVVVEAELLTDPR